MVAHYQALIIIRRQWLSNLLRFTSCLRGSVLNVKRKKLSCTSLEYFDLHFGVWEDFNQAATNVVNNENKSEALIMAAQCTIKKENGKAGKGFQEKRVFLKARNRY